MAISEAIDRMLQIAALEVDKRIRETIANNKDPQQEIRKYWLHTSIPRGYDLGYPYCMAFVQWCANAAEIPLPGIVSCSAFAKLAKEGGNDKVKIAYYDAKTNSPRRGDAFLMDTGAEGLYNHVGLVESVSGNVLTTIEGNTTPSTTSNDPKDKSGGVWRRTRSLDKGSVVCFIRFEELLVQPTQQVTPDQAEDIVGILRQARRPGVTAGIQLMCNALLHTNLVVDDKWGPKTEEAIKQLTKKVLNP